MSTPTSHRDTRLMRYLSATGLLGGLPALGQVQYTDVQPDSLAVKNDLGLFFDLDQDGNEDFKIRVESISTYGVVVDAAVVSVVDLYGNSGAAGQFVTTYTSSGSSTGTYAASKFNAGVDIDASRDFSSEMPMAAQIGPVTFGFPWEGGATDGFLGLRLDVNGATH